MRNVEIKLMGVQNLNETVIQIDGKPAKFKKNKFGNVVCNYETNKDTVNIKIFKLLDVGGIFWFITQLFFFVISIFGIFDTHQKLQCWAIDFETEFDLQDKNGITLQFVRPKEKEQAFKIQTELPYREISNECYVDAKAKKTLKTLKITKIILAIAILALAAFLLVKVIF